MPGSTRENLMQKDVKLFLRPAVHPLHGRLLHGPPCRPPAAFDAQHAAKLVHERVVELDVPSAKGAPVVAQRYVNTYSLPCTLAGVTRPSTASNTR